MNIFVIIVILIIFSLFLFYIKNKNDVIENFDNIDKIKKGFLNINNQRVNKKPHIDYGPVIFKQELPYFNKVKFHIDYKDTMTAINDLIPSQKQYFNIANIPLTNYAHVPSSEVVDMVNDFVNLFNYVTVKNDDEFKKYENSGYIVGGWQDKLTRNNTKDGWEDAQKKLGLKPSLYNPSAKNAPLEIISIRDVQKFETDDEIKYVILLTLHKINVQDQIIIRLSLVLNKKTIRNEDEFWKTKVKYENDYTFVPNYDIQMIIENIDIVGYLTIKQTSETENDGDNNLYCKYDELEYGNVTDAKYIQKELLKKYAQRNDEINKRNATLDEEGQEFHRSMIGTYDYPNIKNTQTIFDDMNEPRIFN
ncbi:hypothetical protein Hokovirus_2_87 [Hokovirus HKV1]|uniref:Uncharacterized protein n=1 Tax=Hokovirus HKV1 TaxID=1977638 RepID=A0A1V0SFR3_9VIRU|nr:hypothetical protein Hokovirus_2_87 [Hokovirus HKV1]